MAQRTLNGTALIGAFSVLVAVTACGHSRTTGPEKPGTPGETSFTSKVPYSDSRATDDGIGAEAGDDFAAGAGGSTAGPVAPDKGADDPARAILEADIIKVEGNTLFALSRYSGLSLIDITN